MEQRDFERLITIPPKERAYCTVCKTFATEGEFYRFKENKYVGRHLTCTPKHPRRPRSVTEDEQKREDDKNSRATSAKRRRAGGHGYTGGDGWVSI